jgi:mutator protein MutT
MYTNRKRNSTLIVFPSRFPYLLCVVKVAVGIFSREGSVLLCQRKKNARYGLKWEFPGGKFEDGETAEECLRRELHEELGVEADIGALFHREHHNYPDSGTFDVFYHLVPSFRGELVNAAFADIRWVPLNDLTGFDILEGNRGVVEKLLNAHGPAKRGYH